jgi:hypothetical protein
MWLDSDGARVEQSGEPDRIHQWKRAGSLVWGMLEGKG